MDETTPAVPPGTQGSDTPAGGPTEAARIIGHDLNNCAGIIGGRAELALMYLDRGDLEAARKGVETVLAQVERLKKHSEALRELRPRA